MKIKPKKFKCPECGKKFCLIDMGILLDGENLEQLEKLEISFKNNIISEEILGLLHGKKKK